MSFKLHVLPANNGDALLIRYKGTDGKPHNIWIDGGLVKSYKSFHKQEIEKIRDSGEKLDLMVVTHIDQDHIGGVLAFMKDNDIDKDILEKFWFNSGRIISNYFETPPDARREVPMNLDSETGERSLAQGMVLEDMLEEMKIWHDLPILAGEEFDFSGARLILVSPDEEGIQKLNKEWQEELQEDAERGLGAPDYEEEIEDLAENPERPDTSIPNGSSIAFILEFGGKRLLLTGDAHSDVVAPGLRALGYSEENPIQLDYLKLSHHGSKASTTHKVLDLIDCQNFIISTDASRHNLPNKEIMSRILMHPERDPEKQITFIFNYDNETVRGIFSQEEMEKYNFRCLFPKAGDNGYTIDLEPKTIHAIKPATAGMVSTGANPEPVEETINEPEAEVLSEADPITEEVEKPPVKEIVEEVVAEIPTTEVVKESPVLEVVEEIREEVPVMEAREEPAEEVPVPEKEIPLPPEKHSVPGEHAMVPPGTEANPYSDSLKPVRTVMIVIAVIAGLIALLYLFDIL